MCERWVGDRTNCNILTPRSFVFSRTSFSFCWAAQSGVLRAYSPLLCAGCWFSLPHLISNLTDSNQLNFLSHRVISLFDTHLLPVSNPPTVKVIPWCLRLDAPVPWLTAGSKVNMLKVFCRPLCLYVLPVATRSQASHKADIRKFNFIGFNDITWKKPRPLNRTFTYEPAGKAHWSRWWLR